MDLRDSLLHAGIPEGFSVLGTAQLVPGALARAIDDFIAVFERVTTRPRWQRAALADAPRWLREPHAEVCFFSAWDFHVPDDEHWRLIEFNDNGSGFLFASIINRTYYELAGLTAVEAPASAAQFAGHLVAMIEREIDAFFGARLDGAVLVLDDAAALARGHFRVEHDLLVGLLRARGFDAIVGAPDELAVTGDTLRHRGRDVRFVVNRSTDFLWAGDAFAPLRQCFAAGSVYAAPNPFTYLTRSDKRLLALLSSPARDAELGIEPEERAVLAARVPETVVLRPDNLDELVRRKHELFFKPAHGYASHGTIASTNIGRSRLRRLVRDGEPYVAQRFVPKGRIVVDGRELLADLRVWSYRGERYLVSGRATASEELRDPRAGGWLPTYVGDGRHAHRMP